MKESKTKQSKTLGTFWNKKKFFYNAVSAGNFCGNSYTKYEINGDINKTLSIKEYLDKDKPFSKDINNLKKFDTWKIELLIPIKFISSKA